MMNLQDLLAIAAPGSPIHTSTSQVKTPSI